MNYSLSFSPLHGTFALIPSPGIDEQGIAPRLALGFEGVEDYFFTNEVGTLIITTQVPTNGTEQENL